MRNNIGRGLASLLLGTTLLVSDLSGDKVYAETPETIPHSTTTGSQERAEAWPFNNVVLSYGVAAIIVYCAYACKSIYWPSKEDEENEED
jgi:hypothetical protein